MIYGPYSSGWRDSESAKEKQSARRWAVVGLVVVMASGAAAWGALGYFAGWF